MDSGLYPKTGAPTWFYGWSKQREGGFSDFGSEIFRLRALPPLKAEIFRGIREVVEYNITGDSHPGYPWCKLGSDNKAVLTGFGDLIWDEVAKRFNNMLGYGDAIFSMTPSELVQNGICDAVKVFIKQEPHSLEKVNAGRLRIIAAVGLVDQIVTRLLCMKQNNAEIDCWESCPSAPGMGLNDEGLRTLYSTAQVMAEHGTICETDISGWDWSVQQWELDSDARLRTQLAGEEIGGYLNFFLRVHAYVVGHSVFVMPDGEMLEQTVPGGQLSGDYNTSSSNSRMRVIATMFARYLAGQVSGFPLLGIKAMGDDSFEIWFKGLEEYLGKMGHTVKMCVQRPGLVGFEFCSQVFLGLGIAYPVDFSKTLYRFLSHHPADPKYSEYRAQLMYYFRHLPSSTLQKVIRLAGARVERAQKLATSSN
ncbi:orf3; putative RNA-dependent RNA polymerase [Mushroom bacilliform virus]|uniref:RNA-directed RNA polymerase n=2 Tax=Mushroom bacilliform virus TaxID=32625 RepID=RDRP_MBVLF|nr:RecName: Full=RNA-directed RNA polymerase [Mushroom bacilliform virus LF-1/AUS]AAA53090.1 orf3; putative RNA-dependent RNA polymerase [Mushroom bacilliform virus]